MDAQEKKRRTLIVKEYSLHDLAEYYGMSAYRLRTRIKKYIKTVGKRVGYYYTIEQVKKIIQLIPLPSDVDVV